MAGKASTVAVRNETTRRLRLHATVDEKVHRVQFGGVDDHNIVNAPQPVQVIDAKVWAVLEKQKPVRALLDQGVLRVAA